MDAVETSEQGVGIDSANIGSELDSPRWAVISFDRVEARSQSYAEAFATMEALEAAGIAGLCVVADEAAARIAD